MVGLSQRVGSWQAMASHGKPRSYSYEWEGDEEEVRKAKEITPEAAA